MPYAARHLLPALPDDRPTEGEGADDLRRRKEFKEIAWVSEAVFRRLARGEPPDDAVDGKAGRSRSTAARSG